MRKTENNRRSPMPMGVFMMRMAAVLFCLVIISVYLTSGLYARYTASGSGKDSARVAAFDVRAAGELANALIEPAETDGIFTITVQNKSEVAIAYDIYLELEEPLPAGVTVTLVDKDPAIVQNEGKNHVFANVGTMAVGAPEMTHEMKFLVDWNQFTKDKTGPAVEIPVDFKVRIVATQID